MAWNGVVMPHPPVRRAIQETAQALRRKGHDGKQKSFMHSFFKLIKTIQ